MNIFTLAILGLISSFSIIFINKYNPEISLTLSVAAGVLLLVLLLPNTVSLMKEVNNIIGRIGNSKDIFFVALKTVGVSIVTEFASDVCSDFGQKSIASKIEFGGKITVLIIVLPFVLQIMDTVVDLIDDI